MAIFLTQMEQSSLLQIASRVIESVPEFADVDPVIFPLPRDAPPEFPQILINNEEKGWRLQFSPMKCDLFYSPESPDDFSLVLEQVQAVASKLWDVLEQQLLAHGNRLGLVANFESRIENASQVIVSKYIKSGFIQNAHEVRFHYLQKFTRGDFSLNCWVRIQNRVKSAEATEALQLLVDVNTVAEKPLPKVNVTIIQRFAEVAGEIVSDSLVLHEGDLE